MFALPAKKWTIPRYPEYVILMQKSGSIDKSPQINPITAGIHLRERADRYTFQSISVCVLFGLKHHLLIVGHTPVCHGAR